jgi:hypothetical protein
VGSCEIGGDGAGINCGRVGGCQEADKEEEGGGGGDCFLEVVVAGDGGCHFPHHFRPSREVVCRFIGHR